jgi:hypothetical protein
MQLLNTIGIRGNYTFQTTEKTGDTYDSSMVLTTGLPELPEHKANIGIEYIWPQGMVAGLAMRFVGEKEVITGSLAKTNAAALEHVKPFATFRLYGTVPVWTKEKYSAKLKIGIDNLFNVAYEEEPGVPMPGVTGTAAAEFTF